MLFEKRKNIKPYEYPNFVGFKDAIRQSYWVHDEFNFEDDVQDFKVECTDAEREAIKRTMLAIAQIELDVKTFWGDLHQQIPKPEVAFVGSTYAESEVRHMDAYSHLLEILGLNDVFEEIQDIPAIQDRIDYLEDFKTDFSSPEDVLEEVVLFSMFIEYVSLFSQFFIMLGFEKHTNRFTGISNAVSATSKEEQIHGLFGIELVNTALEENPDLLPEDWEHTIVKACMKAYEAEIKILDWIFEEGELDFLPKSDVEAYLRLRFNKALTAIGIEELFEVSDETRERLQWMEDEVTVTTNGDFFDKRGTTYSKNMQPVTAGDLF